MATKFPPPAPPFIAARHKGGKQTPKALVIHGTVSKDTPGTARNIANWWAGPTSPKTSCHYVVDPRDIIQSVGDHTIAFHCGSNTNTIGIELCDEQTGPASRWHDANSQAIIRKAARLAAELCLAYNIEVKRPSVADLKKKGKHGIYGHNDSRLAFGGTTHTDPRDFPWGQFMDLVKKEVAAIKAANKKPTTPAVPKFKNFPRSETVFWNMKVGKRVGVAEALDAIAASGARRIGLIETGGHWPAIRAWAKKNGFSVFMNEGEIGRTMGWLVKHGSMHKVHATWVALSPWVGPQGGKHRGRPISIQKARVNGRPVMTILVHQVWGPGKNTKAKAAVAELIVKAVAENPNWDIYIVGDFNEKFDKKTKHSPRWIANTIGARNIAAGTSIDLVLFRAAIQPVPGIVGQSVPTPTAHSSKVGEYGGDHPVVGILF